MSCPIHANSPALMHHWIEKFDANTMEKGSFILFFWKKKPIKYKFYFQKGYKITVLCKWFCLELMAEKYIRKIKCMMQKGSHCIYFMFLLNNIDDYRVTRCVFCYLLFEDWEKGKNKKNYRVFFFLCEQLTHNLCNLTIF